MKTIFAILSAAALVAVLFDTPALSEPGRGQCRRDGSCVQQNDGGYGQDQQCQPRRDRQRRRDGSCTTAPCENAQRDQTGAGASPK